MVFYKWDLTYWRTSGQKTTSTGAFIFITLSDRLHDDDWSNSGPSLARVSQVPGIHRTLDLIRWHPQLRVPYSGVPTIRDTCNFDMLTRSLVKLFMLERSVILWSFIENLCGRLCRSYFISVAPWLSSKVIHYGQLKDFYPITLPHFLAISALILLQI